MVLCDMCGKEKDLMVADIEGTELNVCDICAKHGKIIRKIMPIKEIKHIRKKEKIEIEEEIIERIIEGYGHLIKEARERLELTQEDFAKKINEKSSIIHNIESEHHEPDVKLARKLEKFLKIELIQKAKVEKTNMDHINSTGLTIGDLIKIKK